ncbi:hypothetical protein ACIPMZ_01690 [Scandinavium goeteborgense]|jgi:hypothetical protein|uniref:hypothetical protein n=1 Tax=Scandinavium goeteborgense TaxID=1851514 RepID=UPI0037F63DAC
MKTTLLKDTKQFELWAEKMLSLQDFLTKEERDTFLTENAPTEYPCLAWIKYTDDIFRHGVADFIYKAHIDGWAESLG